MPIINFKPGLASRAQQEYLAILFNDCGMNLLQQKDFLELRTSKRFLDEITFSDAAKLIEELLELKERKKGSEFR